MHFVHNYLPIDIFCFGALTERVAIILSPGLAKWPDFDIERPGGSILMRDVPDFVGDCRRRDEKFVRRVGETLARPLEIDNRVDEHIGHVHALRSDFARDRFRENPLRGFGRRESGKLALPRSAEVLPLAMIAPSPTATIAGASRRAR